MSLYSNNAATVAANIARIRTEQNLTVADLAERTSFRVDQIEAMERGEFLNSFTVAEVARWMGVTHAELVAEYTAPVAAPANDWVSRLERALAQCEAR